MRYPVLTDEQLIDQLRASLRADRRDPSPDLLERIHDQLLLENQRPDRRQRRRMPGLGRAASASWRLAHVLGVARRRVTLGGAVSGFAAIVAIAIAVGAVALLGHARPASKNATGGTSERELLAQYAVLRRPQTTADRVDAGAPPNLNAGPSAGGSSGKQSYTQRIVGLAPLTNVPSLTRVVSLDGVKVSLFVEHLTPSNALPTVITHAHPAAYRPGGITREGLLFQRRNRNRLAGYTLWARVAGDIGGQPARAQLVAPLKGPIKQVDGGLTGPGDVIFAVVPDEVAHVRWTWPPQFDTSTLKHDAALTIKAAASQNVVIARAARYLPPATATWYAASGQVITRLHNPNGSVAGQYGTYDPSIPGPETQLSRRAKRNPSTSNPVLIVPNTASRSSARQFYFHVLLNNRTYFLRVTGGPHPGCVTPNPQAPQGPGYGAVLHPPDQVAVRGDTYQGSSPRDIITCPGTYRLSISVLNNQNHPDPPFGSASFTVR